MSFVSRLFLALIAALALTTTAAIAQPPAPSGAAATQAERFPQTGAPAFDIAPLPGWTINRASSDSLGLVSGDTAVAMTYIMFADDPKASHPDEAIAAALFTALGSPASSRKDAISVGGHPGQDFIATMVREDGMQLDLHLVLVRLDPGHVAIVAITSQFGDGGTGLAQGKAQLAKTRFIIQ